MLTTGLLAFVIAAVVLTVPELIAGGSIGGRDRATTLVPSKKKSNSRSEPAETVTEQQPTVTETVPSEPRTVTETTPTQPRTTQTSPAPQTAPPTTTTPATATTPSQ